jgi:DNA-binding beta-propeller fold protein YncE
MGRKSIQNLTALVFCIAAFAACVKDRPESPVVTPSQATNGNIYVVCEGSYGNGDATLYEYDRQANAVAGDLYKAANNTPLGDVFQSMVRIDDKLFLSINNSDKIVVVNKADKKLVGTISIPKPRYILPVNSTKAYVSLLYNNKVYIINPQTLQVTGSVQLPNQNAEGMAMYNGMAYVCCWDTACHNVYAIDVNTDMVVKTIPIAGSAPQEAVVDKDNRLWVLSGNTTKGKVSNITVINANDKLAKSYTFPDKADVVKPVFDKAKENLYFIEVNYYNSATNNGIYRMNIADTVLPANAFVAAQQYQYFWALGIDPETGKVFVGDPKGFVQKGSILVYNTDGTLSTQFNVGIGPGHFYFDN